MRIIVYKPEGAAMPSADTLRRYFEEDPDGAGLMWPERDRVQLRKGLMGWDGLESALSSELSRGARGSPRHPALPHRDARKGQARVLPPIRRVQGLRGHARGIRQRRRGVHAQRDAGRARYLAGRVRQHGVRPQRPRPAQGDARRPLGRGPATHRRGDRTGLALPAHDRRRARLHVRELGRRGGLPLLEHGRRRGRNHADDGFVDDRLLEAADRKWLKRGGGSAIGKVLKVDTLLERANSSAPLEERCAAMGVVPEMRDAAALATETLGEEDYEDLA